MVPTRVVELCSLIQTVSQEWTYGLDLPSDGSKLYYSDYYQDYIDYYLDYSV